MPGTINSIAPDVQSQQFLTSLLECALEIFLQDAEGRLTLLAFALTNKRTCKEVAKQVEKNYSQVSRNTAGVTLDDVSRELLTKIFNALVIPSVEQSALALRLRNLLTRFRDGAPVNTVSRLVNPFIIQTYTHLSMSLAILEHSIGHGLELYNRQLTELNTLHEDLNNHGAYRAFSLFPYTLQGCVEAHVDVAECKTLLEKKYALSFTVILYTIYYSLLVAVALMNLGHEAFMTVPDIRRSFAGNRSVAVLATLPEDLASLIEQFLANEPNFYTATALSSPQRKTVSWFLLELNEYIDTRLARIALWSSDSNRKVYSEGLGLFNRRVQRMYNASIEPAPQKKLL